MIDLHIHTTYSDGSDSVEEVLKKAEEKKLTYISITDHDNCKAYQELKKLNIKKYYTGKIIPGIEIKCVYGGNLVEVLGYNIDPERMQKWADEYYKDKSKAKLQKKYIDILYKKAQEMGLKINKEEIEKFDPEREWASVRMFKAIRRHKENEKFFPKGTLETFDNFSKKYCANRKSKLYIDKTKDYPPIQEVIKVIKQCNGLAFLPHLFIYKWAENKEEFIKNILKDCQVDGIECMHSEFTESQIKYLLN